MGTSDRHEILTRLRTGDPGAMKDLFDQHYRPVCQTMRRYIADQSLIQDLAQNIFIRLWEKRGQLEIHTSIGAYLNRMALHEALGHLRRNLPEDPVEQLPDHRLDAGADTLLLDEEIQEMARRAIDKLPPQCRIIFQLSRYEELSYREIADHLNLSVKTVENQMGKALRILREQIFLNWG